MSLFRGAKTAVRDEPPGLVAYQAKVGDSVARLPRASGIRSVARSVQPRFLA